MNSNVLHRSVTSVYASHVIANITQVLMHNVLKMNSAVLTILEMARVKKLRNTQSEEGQNKITTARCEAIQKIST